MAQTVQSMGVNLGFYTSRSQWDPITGGASNFGNSPLWYNQSIVLKLGPLVPLSSFGQPFSLSITLVLNFLSICRYAHYDNNPSFSDFVPFGGWSQPTIKQFAGDQTVCGIDTDLNYSQ
jgi:hypothetical protein